MQLVENRDGSGPSSDTQTERSGPCIIEFPVPKNASTETVLSRLKALVKVSDPKGSTKVYPYNQAPLGLVLSKLSDPLRYKGNPPLYERHLRISGAGSERYVDCHARCLHVMGLELCLIACGCGNSVAIVDLV